MLNLVEKLRIPDSKSISGRRAQVISTRQRSIDHCGWFRLSWFAPDSPIPEPLKSVCANKHTGLPSNLL
jgi:hypothetical protein